MHIVIVPSAEVGGRFMSPDTVEEELLKELFGNIGSVKPKTGVIYLEVGLGEADFISGEGEPPSDHVYFKHKERVVFLQRLEISRQKLVRNEVLKALRSLIS